MYGIANKLGLDKKDFQGIHDAYEFDPRTEKFTKVAPMNEARWYPTLTRLSDGRVLALSGLDDIGQVVPGKSEIYDSKTRTWTYSGKVRQFPTYPAVFHCPTAPSSTPAPTLATAPTTSAAPRASVGSPPTSSPSCPAWTTQA